MRGRGIRRRCAALASALLASALLASTPQAGAQRLTLEVAGSSAEAARLRDALADAVALWEEGYGEPLDIVLAEEGDSATGAAEVASFRLGDPALLGPDVASLTLQRSGAPTEVQIAPGWLDTLHPVLHELGVVLGLEPAPSGVMAVAIAADPAERPSAPQPADLAALRNALRFPPEDLTRDGVVDFYDLLELAEVFGARGFLPADLNDDGVVDLEDLTRLQAAYTFTAPSPTPPGTAADASEPQPAEGAPGAPDEGAEPTEPAPAGDGSAEPSPLDALPAEPTPREGDPGEGDPGDGSGAGTTDGGSADGAPPPAESDPEGGGSAEDGAP